MAGDVRHRRIFGPMTSGAAHAVVFLFILSLAVGALNFFWTSRVVSGANTRARALCQFDAHLGSAPVSLNPSTRKASLLGVQIVSDARVAWRMAGCEGRLPAPDPSFVKWARYYKLPAG